MCDNISAYSRYRYEDKNVSIRFRILHTYGSKFDGKCKRCAIQGYLKVNPSFTLHCVILQIAY